MQKLAFEGGELDSGPGGGAPSHIELQDQSRDIGMSPQRKIAGDGQALDESNVDELINLIEKKRNTIIEKQDAIQGSEYKTSDNMSVSRKGTLKISMRGGGDSSAKKFGASGRSKSGGISQMMGGNTTSFKLNEDGNLFEDTQINRGFLDIVNKYADGKDKCYLYMGLFCAFLFGCSIPAFLYLFGRLVDELGISTSVMNYDFGILNEICVAAMILGVFVFIVSFGQIVLTSHFADTIAFKMSVAYFERSLKQDISFYDKASAKKVAKKLKDEIGIIRDGLGENHAYAVQSLTVFIVGFIVAFVRGWLLTLMLLPGFPIIIGTGLSLAVAISRRGDATQKSYSKVIGIQNQALNAIKLVQAYNNEEIELRIFGRSITSTKLKSLREIRIVALSIGLIYFLFYCFYSYSLWVGGRLRVLEFAQQSNDRSYTGGQVLTILLCVVLGSVDLVTVITHIQKISAGKRAASTIIQVTENKALLVDDVDGSKGKTIPADVINFQNVSFKYQNGKTALKDFTEVFEANKSTAIFGEADADTSAIINLIERFYDPQGGNITIGNESMDFLDIRTLRQSIGYVDRDPAIFKGTIRDNLQMSSPDATDEEMTKLLLDLNAWTFLQDGLETRIRTGQSKLSGGQLQQIAIARALIKKPQCLLLDEATSAMDQTAVEALLNTIKSYRDSGKSLTVVIVAFRIITFKTMDKIVVLQRDGTKGPVGTHEELISMEPHCAYSQYCKKIEGSQSQRRQVDVRMTDIGQRMKANIGNIFMSPQKDAQNRLIEEEVDEELIEKLKQAQMKDEGNDRMQYELRKQQNALNYSQRINDINKDSKGMIALGFICCIISGIIQPIFGILFSELIFYATENTEIFGVSYGEEVPGEENMLCLYVVFIAIALGLVIGLRFYAFGSLAQKLTHVMRLTLYDSILNKDQSFFEEEQYNDVNYLISVIQDDAESLSGVSIERHGPLVESICAVVTAIIIAGIFRWQQMIVCIICLPVIILCARTMWKYQQGLTVRAPDFMEEAVQLSEEMIQNFKTVQAFGLEDKIVEKYKSLLQKNLEMTKQTNFQIGIFFGLAEGLFIVVFGILFFASGFIIKDNPTEDGTDWEYDASELFICIFATVFAGVQAGSSEFFAPDSKNSSEAAVRVFEILDHVNLKNPKVLQMGDDNESLLSAANIKGKIEFKNVWFRNPNDRMHFVLKGVSFVIEPNQSVAFVGQHGAGKSTIAHLLLRFYDPDFGEILIDDQNIQAYKLKELRQQLSMVLQKPVMFNNSILENILYGNLKAKNSEIEQAAQTANCQDFIESGKFYKWNFTAESLAVTMMQNRNVIVDKIGEQRYNNELALMQAVEDEDDEGKFKNYAIDYRDEALKDKDLINGYNEQAGIEGCRLSIDQKQRIAIARAIVFKPRVLLVDDAILNYNQAGALKVKTALENAMKENTAILFTERANYASRLVDKIFVIEGGKIAEQGTYQELVAQNGVLSKLIMNE